MAKSKPPRGKGPKASAVGQEKPAAEEPGYPLRAYPADPPRKNLPLLIVSAVLFAAWFCFLAYVALRG